jgi:acyl carrier protein
MSQTHLAFLHATETWTRSLMVMNPFGASVPDGAPIPDARSALPEQAANPVAPAPELVIPPMATGVGFGSVQLEAPGSFEPETTTLTTSPPTPVTPTQPAVAPPAPPPALVAQPSATPSSPAYGETSQRTGTLSSTGAMAVLATGLSEEARQALEAGDLQELLLTIVADKTGYPKEILSMDMEFDADLGIDSIKRVEILASVQEYASLSIEDIDPQELIELRTLGQVLEFIRKILSDPSETRAASAG